MKKFLVFLCAVTLVFGMGGMAQAITVYENYTGYQYVGENEEYGFYFDLPLLNDPVIWGSDYGPTGTDSDLTLANDVATGFEGTPFVSAFFNVVLFSEDWASEETGISLTAFYSGVEYDLGTTSWSESTWWPFNDDGYYTITGELSMPDFLADPYGDLVIQASSTGWLNYNDFAIVEVGVGGVPTPEPSTIILLGLGLLGLVGVNRKKFKK